MADQGVDSLSVTRLTLHDEVRAFRVGRIRAALLRHGGNRARAARELGVGVNYVYQAVHRLRLGIPGKIGRPPRRATPSGQDHAATPELGAS